MIQRTNESVHLFRFFFKELLKRTDSEWI